jgi:hypothetical protein
MALAQPEVQGITVVNPAEPKKQRLVDRRRQTFDRSKSIRREVICSDIDILSATATREDHVSHQDSNRVLDCRAGS